MVYSAPSQITFNFGSAVILRIITNLIGLVVVGIMTRSLGPAGYGAYSTIFAYLFIFSIIADMGLGTLLTRDIAQNENNEADIASRYFTLRFLLALLAFVLASTIVWLVPQYDSTIRWGVVVGGGYMVFSALVQILISLFQKHMRIYLVSIADVISRLVQLAVIVIFLQMYHTSVSAFVCATVIGEVAHFAAVWIFSRSLTRVRFAYSGEKFASMLKTAFPVAVSLLFVILYFKMDTVMLSLMRPGQDVGVYAAAYKVLEILIFVPSMLAGLVMPLLSREAINPGDGFRAVMRASFDALSAMALPATAILIILAVPIVSIVGGPGFGAAVPLLQILAIAVLFIFFGNLGGNALVALNLQNKGVWVYGAGAVVNFIANLIFIPRFGPTGAAWNTVITEIVVTFGMFWLIHHAVGSTFSFQRTLRILLATLLMSVIVYVLRQHTVLAFISALSYFPILYAVRGFSMEEVKMLIQN
jgi:O-antigen/teichoic acid export membrane protein